MDAIEKLKLFGIPGGNGEDAVPVREILAGLVDAGAVSLGELQLARDIVERTRSRDPFGYLFLAAMFASRSAGNICLNPSKGLNALRTAASDGEIPIPTLDESWPKAVAASDGLAGDVVLAVNGRWFFQKDFAEASSVRAKIRMRLERVPDGIPSESVLESAMRFSFAFNGEQRAAVRAACTQGLAIVTGGPGTGKTTIVCAILRALFSSGILNPDDVALVAPTGRAAQRMGESLRTQCANAEDLSDGIRTSIENLEGGTIHRLLGGRAPDFEHGPKNRLPLKLVVVDESSMVDVSLMDHLLSSLRDDCRLILLGDADQLPSVGAGALLRDVVADNAGVVRLVASNRFRGKLAACAEAVNEGNVDAFHSAVFGLTFGDPNGFAAVESVHTENGGFFMEVPAATAFAAVQEAVVDWVKRFGWINGGLVDRASEDWSEDPALKTGIASERSRTLFDVLDRSRVLSVVRRGPLGVDELNEKCRQARFGNRKNDPFENPGVPVLVTRNTPDRNLWNGDIGVTVRDRNGMITAVFPRGDKVVSCPVGLLPEHELAYVITVHKSQGSEFGNVLVVLPTDSDHPLLCRQIVYTGLTRAKTRGVVLGTEAALETSLEKRAVRDTGIFEDPISVSCSRAQNEK